MMETIGSSAELQAAITRLEIKQKEDLILLKQELSDVKERLKPKNMLKSGIKNLKNSPKLRTALIIAGAAIVAGVITKKIISRRRRRSQHYKKMQFQQGTFAGRQVKKASSSLIKYLLAAILSQNADKIKNLLYHFLKNLKTKPSKEETTKSETTQTYSDIPY